MTDRKSVQADLRRAHVNGAAGVLVSGLVWLVTATVWHLAAPRSALIAVFLGGIAIAPIAAMLTKFGFRAPAATAGKRLEWIALATVPIILAGFYAAWRWLGPESGQAIPLVAIAVGLRYLTFTAMFGTWRFLWLGGAFIAVGVAAYLSGSWPAGATALLLGVIELIFAVSLYRSWRQPAETGA